MAQKRIEAPEYGGGFDAAESILLLIEERIRDLGEENADIAAIAEYAGRLLGLALITRVEHGGDNGMLARAVALMASESTVYYCDRFDDLSGAET